MAGRRTGAGWQRLTFRISGLGTAAGGGWGLWEHQEAVRTWWENPDAVPLAAFQTGGISVASAAAAGGLAYGLLTRERRELMREWVTPLHQALAVPLGIAEQTDPRRYLHVPRNFSDVDAQIRVDLPVSLRFSRDLVADLITQKLALEGVTFSWHPAGRKPYVLVKKTRKPPKKAAFKDPKVLELVAKAPESAPLIGIGTGGKTVAVDLDAESPHILVNASTGGGKSVTLRCITCQMLHHGSQAFILDYKRISHPWARGIPGVTYCADIADIHDALVQLGWEGRRRTRVADELGIDADPDDIGRLLILLEEVNATLRQPARHWETVRQPGELRVSPAFTALTDVLFAGGMVRMHVFFDGDPTLSVPGLEGREQFSTVILGWVPTVTWRRFAPAAGPALKDRGRLNRGRVHVVQGGDTVRQTQVLNLTGPEALARATGVC
ncbi:hypothetical protein AB5J49_36235 [Streptomyces sp. R28]|uniref:FtsK domain-containing protein n=1 Tax=Streptomyces sp. R28 TaxID=3238628 RepID=A0AB39Q898_9ACTN